MLKICASKYIRKVHISTLVMYMIKATVNFLSLKLATVFNRDIAQFLWNSSEIGHHIGSLFTCHDHDNKRKTVAYLFKINITHHKFLFSFILRHCSESEVELGCKQKFCF